MDAVIDAAHLDHQRAWSAETFGPGPRTLGVVDHIRKELDEILADPTDLSEWVDVIILAFDGAWRAGWEPQEIIDAIKVKQARNEARSWPDWRTASADHAIEHIRQSGPSADHIEPFASVGDLTRFLAEDRQGRLRARLISLGVSPKDAFDWVLGLKIGPINEALSRSSADEED